VDPDELMLLWLLLLLNGRVLLLKEPVTGLLDLLCLLCKQNKEAAGEAATPFCVPESDACLQSEHVSIWKLLKGLNC
jgi:hypothetical protein